MVGTAVLRMVVSSDSMKKATAMSQGSRRLLEGANSDGEEGTIGVEGAERLVSEGIELCRRLPANCRARLREIYFH